MTKFGDRYGYYQIGDVKTYSRYELMDLYRDSPQEWKWHYNDEFFNSYDWTIEPKESINELYRKRAEQLRKDYDYLILYYSGGYDSVNMLHAFLDNDIYPDEICIFYSRFDNVSNQHKELKTITWNKFKKLKEKYSKIVFREIDYADYFFTWHKQIESLNLNKDLLYMFGAALSVNHLVTDLLFQHVNDWKQLLNQGKKLAWLHGVDKPQLRYYNNQWLFNFHDGLTQVNVSPMRQMIDDGKIGTYEFFYWGVSNETANILIKQCHLLKKFYNKQAQEDFSKIEGAKPYKEGYGWEVDKMSLPYVKTIYPRNFIGCEEYFVEKNTFHIWGNRDQWFFNSAYPGSDVHWRVYQSLFKEDKTHYRNWYNDGMNIDSGFKNAMSCDYIV